MKLIETKTLGTAAASIEFTSIPQTFTDLVLKLSIRNDFSDTQAFDLLVNGTQVTSYRNLVGTGSATASNTNYLGLAPASNSTSNTFGSNKFYIPNYRSAVSKSISVDSVTENNATAAFQTISAGLSAVTAAITSLRIDSRSSSFVAGSTISLYGITAGSDGIVVVS
jgi:hypothetical protein